MKRKILLFVLSVVVLTALVPSFHEVKAHEDIYLARVRVATGTTHSMALHADGTLWMWGENTFGQLGNGRTTIYGQMDAPVNQLLENHDEYRPIKIMDNIVAIAAGDGFSLAVNENGELFSWGANTLGQLGNGTQTNQTTPAKIMDDVVFIDAQGRSAIAITRDNRLWRWGRDVTEWGNTNPILSPVYLASNVKTAAVGVSHILFATHDNRLYGIGQVSNLGIYDGNPNLSPAWDGDPFVHTPTLVLTNIRDVVANSQTSFAITSDNRLYGWGPNGTQGNVGSGSTAFWVNLPQFVMDDVQSIFPGGMLLRSDNSLWIWGGLSSSVAFRSTSADGIGVDMGGSLGDVIVQYGNRPVQLKSNVLTACGGGGWHYLVVDRELNLFSWGSNQFGQLGTGSANVYTLQILEGMGPEGDGYMYEYTYLSQNHELSIPTHIGNVLSAMSAPIQQETPWEPPEQPQLLPGLSTTLPPQALALISPEVLAGVTDTASAVEAVQNALAVANDPAVIAHGLIELFADHAIANAASVAVSGNNVEISAASIEPVRAIANITRTAIYALFRAAGYTPRRPLNVGVSFVLETSTANIQVETSAAQTQIEQVFIRTPYFELYFPPNFIAENVSDTSLNITIGAENPFRVTFSRSVDSTVRLAVPPRPGNTRYQTLQNSAGEAIGGKHNPATGLLEARISESDTFTVVENRIDFADVQHLHSEMQNAIRLLASQGVISGTGGGNFSPDDATNRAHLATIIMRMLGLLDPNADGGFIDVARADWFFGAAGSANRHGVMSGTGGGEFSPTLVLPRDQLTAVAARVLRNEMNYSAPAVPGNYLQVFADHGDFANWSVDDLALATRESLISLRADGQFLPRESMTRGDVALMLYRLHLLLW